MTAGPDAIETARPLALKAVSEAFHANAAALRAAGIERLVVFGSVARRDDTASSDIDILVVPDPDVIVGGIRLAQWRSQLSEITGRAADAVVSEFLSDRVRAVIEGEGVDAFQA